MHRALILMSLGFSLAACAADNGDEGIFLSKNVAPGMGCTFAGSPTELFTPHGTYSLFADRGYTMYPQLVSQITANDSNLQQRTIQLRGARVDLELTDSSLSGVMADGVTHFKSLFSAPLTPNGGVTDGAFEMIPTALVDAIASAKGITPMTVEKFKTEIIAHVVVYGDLAGDEVTSQEYLYPVTICNDCVTKNLGACPLPAGTTVIASTNPCSSFQDGVVDCCLANGDLVCPGVVMPPPP